MKQKVIISTDCALGALWHDPDDSLAILYLLENPAVQVEAIITTYGNSTEKEAARALQELLAGAKVDIPVIRGAASPKDPCLDVRSFFQSINPENYVIFSIGPLTNLGILPPDYLARFRDFYLMGGALRVLGNMPPTFRSEFNIAKDPKAAAKIFASRPTHVVPLDTTRKAPFCTANIKQLRQKHPKITRRVARRHFLNQLVFCGGAKPHDLILGFALTNPESFHIEKVPITVKRAATVAHSKEAPLHSVYLAKPTAVAKLYEGWLCTSR